MLTQHILFTKGRVGAVLHLEDHGPAFQYLQRIPLTDGNMHSIHTFKRINQKLGGKHSIIIIKKDLYNSRQSIIDFILRRYKDSVSSENMVFPYRCKSTMLMQRNVSTLVSDEDKAIFW